jgi:Zn-dependent peptidase ImmA (M78 family)/transcriptional regulator with XRE-family HTH domain
MALGLLGSLDPVRAQPGLSGLRIGHSRVCCSRIRTDVRQVIQEMKAVSQHELGERVADARRRKGWTQGELAARVGLTQTSVSRIETGGRAVSSLELAELAEVLGVSVLDLLRAGQRPMLAIAARLGHFRDPSAVDRALRRAEALIRLDELLDSVLGPSPPEGSSPPKGPAPLERAVPLRGAAPLGGVVSVEPEAVPPEPEAVPPEPGAVRRGEVGRGPAVDQGRRLAGRVRQALRLGDGPLGPLPEVLEERLRLDVDFSPLPEAVDGLCVSVGERALVLVGSSKPSSRQRFTLAHELAHYLVDDLDPLYVDERGVRARSVAEMRANAFAAHLLMPEPGVRAVIEGFTDDAERAVRVALTFGTSVSAAAYQLGNLGLLPETVRDRLTQAGSRPLLMRYALPSDWQQDESGRGRLRPPSRLYRRATLAFRRGLIGLEPVAELLQRPDRDQLRQELEDAGLAPDEEAFTAAGPDGLDEIFEEMAPGR